jgi:PTS system nitrogen regulatory IIA component
MLISEFLNLKAVVPHLVARNKVEVLQELASTFALVTPVASQPRIQEVLFEREKIGSTGMEKGVAIPHGRMAELGSLVACFGISPEGVSFDARDGRPSHFFFALLAPENSAGIHLKALSKVSRLFRSESLREALLAAGSPEAVYALLTQEDGKS